MLEGISSLVAVVPVIAKADTHTAPELEAYRREVLQVRRAACCLSSESPAQTAGTIQVLCPPQSSFVSL